MTWYKLVRPDGWDFHTGHTINYADHIGETIACRDYRPTEYCGSGLHIAQHPRDCFIGAKIPCRAFRVEPVHGLITIDREKSKCAALVVHEELHDLDRLFGFDYTGLVQFVEALPQIPWFHPDGAPRLTWRFGHSVHSVPEAAHPPIFWPYTEDRTLYAASAAVEKQVRSILSRLPNPRSRIVDAVIADACRYAAEAFVVPTSPSALRAARYRWEVWQKGYLLVYEYPRRTLYVAKSSAEMLR